MKLSKKGELRLRKAIEIGGKISQTAVHLTSGTTVIGKAGAILGLLDAISGEAPTLRQRMSSFEELPMSWLVNKAVFAALRKHGALEAKMSQGRETEWSISDGETGVSWVSSSEGLSGPWITRGDRPGAMSLIGRAMWERVGTRLNVSANSWDRMEISGDGLTDSLPSKLSMEISDRTRVFMKAGCPRGILLYGPPGSGKSYIMRDVARSLGGMSIRHRCTIHTSNVLPDIVDMLRPTTLVMDDVDRGSTSDVLDAMESVRKKCSVVIVSANCTDKLDSAFRRPGRFDEWHNVTMVDDAAFSEMVGDACTADKAKLRELPAAYIQEYCLVRKHIGQAEASSKLDELVALSKELAEKSEKGE